MSQLLHNSDSGAIGNATVSDAEFALLIGNRDDLTVYQPVNYLLRRLTATKPVPNIILTENYQLTIKKNMVNQNRTGRKYK
jgi:hypothetical protein